MKLKVGKQYIVKAQRPVIGNEGDVLIYCGARREGQWQGRSIEVANKVREAKQTQPAGNGFKAFFHATLVNTPTGKQWRIDGEAPWQLW